MVYSYKSNYVALSRRRQRSVTAIDRGIMLVPSRGDTVFTKLTNILIGVV